MEFEFVNNVSLYAAVEAIKIAAAFDSNPLVTDNLKRLAELMEDCAGQTTLHIN